MGKVATFDPSLGTTGDLVIHAESNDPGTVLAPAVLTNGQMVVGNGGQNVTTRANPAAREVLYNGASGLTSYSSTTQNQYFGTNASGTLGFHTLPNPSSTLYHYNISGNLTRGGTQGTFAQEGTANYGYGVRYSAWGTTGTLTLTNSSTFSISGAGNVYVWCVGVAFVTGTAVLNSVTMDIMSGGSVVQTLTLGNRTTGSNTNRTFTYAGNVSLAAGTYSVRMNFNANAGTVFHPMVTYDIAYLP